MSLYDFIARILALLCVSIATITIVYPQSDKTKNRLNDKCSVTDKRKDVSNTVEKSVVRNRGLSGIASVENGTVFISGYNSEFTKGKVYGYGLLWQISDEKETVKKLPFGRNSYMHWFDGLNGWMRSPGFGVYITNDGGDIWKRFRYSDDMGSSAFFLDLNSGWYLSKNLSFNQFGSGNEVKRLMYFTSSHIKKLHFSNLKEGLILFEEDGEPHLSNTTDGGQTWDDVLKDEEKAADFQFINEYDGFLLTNKGIYLTQDSGKSWTLIKEETAGKQYGKLFFLNKEHGWILKNEICSTNSGGRDWKCYSLPKEITREYIKEFVFTSADNGWILTEEKLYFTKDKGKTWKNKTLTFDDYCF